MWYVARGKRQEAGVNLGALVAGVQAKSTVFLAKKVGAKAWAGARDGFKHHEERSIKKR